MKITIFSPKNEFTSKQQELLLQVGDIVFIGDRKEYPIQELIDLSQGSEILAVDPDYFGGFEKAETGAIDKLLENLLDLKGIALGTTSYGWINLDYCQKRGIAVTNVPYYSTESVAEHVLAMILNLSKKIILSDRRTQNGNYKLDLGFELKGKTLGIIGLGHIGSRVAELGNVIGMKVIAYDNQPKMIKNVETKSLNEVLSQSDVISINLTDSKETYKFISEREISQMKNGVIIINLAGREIIDEQAMAEALNNEKVLSYTYEGDDLQSGPLARIETAIGLKPFAWYTKEALDRASEIWTNSIISLTKGNPINKVN